MKKLFITVLSYSLILNLFSIQGVRLQKVAPNFSLPVVKASFFVGDAHAQASALMETAKSKKSDFATYYLPTLVMLGVGLMAIGLVTSLKRKSADFYAFIMGALIYFVSVVTSWASEKKKFDKLPDTIDKNTQIEALKAQKKSFEEVHEIVKKRLMLQGAATAAFFGAAGLAAVAYSKEKATLTTSQSQMQAIINEVRTKCSTMPELNVVPPIHDARTMEPMRSLCERRAQYIAQCVTRAQRSQAEIASLNEVVRSPGTSTDLEVRNQQQIEISSGTLMGCLNREMPRRNQEGPGRFSFNQESGKYQEKTPQMYVQFFPEGSDIQEITSRFLPPTPAEELSFLDLWLNYVIPDAHAQIATSAIKGAITADNTINNLTSPSGIAEMLGIEEGQLGVGQPLNHEEAMALCQRSNQPHCGQTEVEAFIAFDQAIREGGNVASGYVVDGATARVAVGGAQIVGRTAVARQVATYVAPHAARHAVVVYAVGASAATVVSFVSGAILVVAVGAAAWQAYEAYDAYTKTSAYQERIERRENMRQRCMEAGLMRRFSRTGRCGLSEVSPLKKAIDIIFPKAYAVVPGISNPAAEVVSEVSAEAETETDKWMFNPKGRMVIYGAITALTAFITYNTNKMKKELEDNIAEIQNLIDSQAAGGAGNIEFEGASEKDMEGDQIIERDIIKPQDVIEAPQENSTSLIQQFMGLLISRAVANVPDIGKLPRTIPCLVPYRGKCASSKAFMSKAVLPQVKYTQNMKNFIASTARMGDLLQRKNSLDHRFLAEAKRLEAMGPALKADYETSQKIINKIRVAQFKEKPIPFKKYEKAFTNKLMASAKRALKRQGGQVNLNNLLGPSPKSPSSFSSFIDSSIMESMFTTPNRGKSKGQGNTVMAMSNTQEFSGKEDEKSSNQGGLSKSMSKDKNFGINTDKRSNIFEQISKRYLLWQSVP